MSGVDPRGISPAKAARRKSQTPARDKATNEKKKPEHENAKGASSRPRLLDAEYQRQRLSGALQSEKSSFSRPQYGGVGFGIDSQTRGGGRMRSNSVGSSLGASKEGKRMKKNPLGGLFSKPSKMEKKEEEKPAASLDKRQKEQKKKLEAELARREQEKQKKDKEVMQILLTYLDEQLAQGTQSRVKTPLGVPRFEAAPPLIPRVFADIAKQ